MFIQLLLRQTALVERWRDALSVLVWRIFIDWLRESFPLTHMQTSTTQNMNIFLVYEVFRLRGFARSKNKHAKCKDPLTTIIPNFKLGDQSTTNQQIKIWVAKQLACDGYDVGRRQENHTGSPFTSILSCEWQNVDRWFTGLVYIADRFILNPNSKLFLRVCSQSKVILYPRSSAYWAYRSWQNTTETKLKKLYYTR